MRQNMSVYPDFMSDRLGNVLYRERVDVLADVVTAMRTGLASYGRSDVRAPWGLQLTQSTGAAFHLVLQGTCWLLPSEHLVLDHYLEALLTKPGALERSEALHQARAEGTFTAVHEAFWAAAKKALGDIEGTKPLVKVLLLHRHQQHADVVAGIGAALAAGTFNEDVIALEARKAAQTAGRAPTVTAGTTAPEPVELDTAQVTPLTPRRLARALPADQRPLPRLEQWDELLQLRRKDSS